MPVSQAATTSTRSDTNKMVILYDNVLGKRPSIYLSANKSTKTKRKICANMPAKKAAMASKKSDINKELKK